MAEPASVLQPEDIEEIAKAAREAATTHNKNWMLAQLPFVQNGQRNLEVATDSGEREELSGGQAEESEEQEGPKKRRRIARSDNKKAVKKKAKVRGLDLARCDRKDEEKTERS
ncbi:hypothetical protein NDU88_011045 [Pleurodeles waltl]|uniref:Uncharacterized protein n=1 Tax=Pleurodeles waltl TaxID=8319 RepID=A0AAV7R204_PLEWA|nr:hypothetical protein NDU88_011045 [Pleurodeles waltl]